MNEGAPTSFSIGEQIAKWHDDPTHRRNMTMGVYAGSLTVGVAIAGVEHLVLTPAVNTYNNAIDLQNQALIDLYVTSLNYQNSLAAYNAVSDTPHIAEPAYLPPDKLTFENHVGSHTVYAIDAGAGIIAAVTVALASRMYIADHVKHRRGQ